MPRLDLDDLPPRIAALLSALGEGEELLLVQHGAVVGRLTMTPATTLSTPEPDLPPEQQMRETFENFRAAIEDEY